MICKLRMIRRQRGMSQTELADVAQVGQSTISSIETGVYIPHVDVALQIAKALGLMVEDIFQLE